MNRIRAFILFLSLTALATSCATAYLKGLDAEGNKVYLGSINIEESEAFTKFVKSRRSEVDKLHYLMKRLTTSKELYYFRDGTKYNWLEAYRGGMWLLRNKYKNNMNAREFIKNHIWHSDATGQPHLVEFPDGTIHVGYYVLMNELDLLENTFK